MVAPTSVTPQDNPDLVVMAFEWPRQALPLMSMGLQTAEGSAMGLSELAAGTLTSLFPATDLAYEHGFMNRASRQGDASSQFFQAEQICVHFPGFAGYRASAAVVAGYKAAESMRPAELKRAAELLEEALTLLAALPLNQHPRRNPEHLQFSVLTALWHVTLASNDADRTLETLTRAYHASFSLTWFATPAYPACRCLVLLGWLQWSQGHAVAARKTWWRVTELFALAVRDADLRRGTIYEELRDVQASAVLAAQGIHMIDGTLPESMRFTADSIADRAMRITGPAGDQIKQLLTHWPQQAM